MLLDDLAITQQQICKNIAQLNWDRSNFTRGFAVNAGLPFKTPEQYMEMGSGPPPTVFNPTAFVKADTPAPRM